MSQSQLLYVIIYEKTAHIVNSICDLVLRKKLLNEDEELILENLGLFLGTVTFRFGKPLLKRDLDLKSKLKEGVQVKSLYHVVTITCCILKETGSNFFTYRMPYVAALFDILREILSLQWIRKKTRMRIEQLFSNFKIANDELPRFNFLLKFENHRFGDGEQRIDLLPKYSEINLRALKGVVMVKNKHFVDFPKQVATAIELSLKLSLQKYLKYCLGISF